MDTIFEVPLLSQFPQAKMEKFLTLVESYSPSQEDLETKAFPNRVTQLRVGNTSVTVGLHGIEYPQKSFDQMRRNLGSIFRIVFSDKAFIHNCLSYQISQLNSSSSRSTLSEVVKSYKEAKQIVRLPELEEQRQKYANQLGDRVQFGVAYKHVDSKEFLRKYPEVLLATFLFQNVFAYAFEIFVNSLSTTSAARDLIDDLRKIIPGFTSGNVVDEYLGYALLRFKESGSVIVIFDDIAKEMNDLKAFHNSYTLPSGELLRTMCLAKSFLTEQTGGVQRNQRNVLADTLEYIKSHRADFAEPLGFISSELSY